MSSKYWICSSCGCINLRTKIICEDCPASIEQSVKFSPKTTMSSILSYYPIMLPPGRIGSVFGHFYGTLPPTSDISEEIYVIKKS